MTQLSEVYYNGKLRTSAVHLKSGTKIITDAPVDNNGKGEAFSPTDLVATSLASCMITIMGIRAQKMDLNIDGISAKVKKYMASDPRRIAKISIVLDMPKVKLTQKEKNILEKAARTCPVALSLDPEITQDVTFLW